MNRERPIRIHLIEDDPILGEALHERFKLEGFEATLHRDPMLAIQKISQESVDLLVCDIRLPRMSGEEVFNELRRRRIHIPVLFITGYGTIEQAVRLLHLGALDYFTKPIDLERLLDRIRSTVLHDKVSAPDQRLGVSTTMRSLRATIDRLVPHPELVVLIEGESGVGKEVVARLVHELACPGAPFEAVNCAAIPEDLVASVLFGHEPGAFTSANRRFAGAFKRAGDGVLFLDEIGDMPLQIQAQLLRVIEDLTFQPLGSEASHAVRCRILCATHQNLEAMVADGRFREDLFYRLSVVRLDVPPLRERAEDIPWLVRGFLEDNAARVGRSAPVLSDSAKATLIQYQWPGNIRELKNRVDRACLFCDGDVLDEELLGLPLDKPRDLQATVRNSETERIRTELAAHAGRIQQTADALGISRKALWQKMKRFDIDKRSF